MWKARCLLLRKWRAIWRLGRFCYEGRATLAAELARAKLPTRFAKNGPVFDEPVSFCNGSALQLLFRAISEIRE